MQVVKDNHNISELNLINPLRPDDHNQGINNHTKKLMCNKGDSFILIKYPRAICSVLILVEFMAIQHVVIYSS